MLFTAHPTGRSTLARAENNDDARLLPNVSVLLTLDLGLELCCVSVAVRCKWAAATEGWRTDAAERSDCAALDPDTLDEPLENVPYCSVATSPSKYPA